MTKDIDEISQNIRDLRDELQRLNDNRFIRVQNSTWRMMWFQLLRGLAFGFGSVAGATIVVSIVGYFLNQIEVVPIIGEWAKQIATEIMNEVPTAGTGN